jgi:hypothetical protein
MTETPTVDTIASSDQFEAQLQAVETRLINEFGSLDEDTVRRHVRDQLQYFAEAKVQVFVPILIERAVRDKLARIG